MTAQAIDHRWRELDRGSLDDLLRWYLQEARHAFNLLKQLTKSAGNLCERQPITPGCEHTTQKIRGSLRTTQMTESGLRHASAIAFTPSERGKPLRR